MLKSLSGWFGRERKDSAAGQVMALHVAGRPVWTPRTYEHMTREGFGKNAVAYRCIRMVAEACASIPLRVEFEGHRAADHPLQRLIDRPNGEQGGEGLREAVYGGLMTSGNAYVEAAAFDDAPSELWSLRPDRMKVVPNRKGWPEAYEYSAGGAKALIGRDEAGWLKVLHLKLWHPYDDWYGFSPLEAAAAAIDVHNASGAWNKALLDNAARPSGALVYGAKASERMSEDQFNRLREQLSDTYAGKENAGRPLLLEGGLDWKLMGLTPAEMDFSEGRYAAARDIALAFGVPGQLLGIPGDNSYANYKEANAAFWRNTVLPLAGKVTRGLSAWLGEKFPGTRVVCDVEGLPALAAERDALWARLEAATFLSEAERRHLAGLSPVPAREVPA